MWLLNQIEFLINFIVYKWAERLLSHLGWIICFGRVSVKDLLLSFTIIIMKGLGRALLILDGRTHLMPHRSSRDVPISHCNNSISVCLLPTQIWTRRYYWECSVCSNCNILIIMLLYDNNSCQDIILKSLFAVPNSRNWPLSHFPLFHLSFSSSSALSPSLCQPCILGYYCEIYQIKY